MDYTLLDIAEAGRRANMAAVAGQDTRVADLGTVVGLQDIQAEAAGRQDTQACLRQDIQAFAVAEVTYHIQAFVAEAFHMVRLALLVLLDLLVVVDFVEAAVDFVEAVAVFANREVPVAEVDVAVEKEAAGIEMVQVPEAVFAEEGAAVAKEVVASLAVLLVEIFDPAVLPVEETAAVPSALESPFAFLGQAQFAVRVVAAALTATFVVPPAAEVVFVVDPIPVAAHVAA